MQSSWNKRWTKPISNKFEQLHHRRSRPYYREWNEVFLWNLKGTLTQL